MLSVMILFELKQNMVGIKESWPHSGLITPAHSTLSLRRATRVKSALPTRCHIPDCWLESEAWTFIPGINPLGTRKARPDVP